MQPTVVIDCFPSCVPRYRNGYAVVAVDVIRASTTAITAVATGRRCFPVASVEEALQVKSGLPDALLVGEIAGDVPAPFELNNSPAKLALRDDVHRPIVLLSSAGTQIMRQACDCDAAYVACFRNYKAVAQHLARHHDRVAVIGAGTRSEFREEDQMCCAWIAEELLLAGFGAENHQTLNLVARWSGVAPEACLASRSAAFLTRTGQLDDLEFVLSHVNDLNAAFAIQDREIVQHPAIERERIAA